MKIEKDVIILGSGPAGSTAGIYLARASIDCCIIAGMQPGGQLTTTTDVENFPGFKKISGPELMSNMHAHAEEYGCKVIHDHVNSIYKEGEKIILKADVNEYSAKAVIIATGASAKWLNLKSEEKYKGAGVSACATCDGFFFRNKIVAVVGGGNSALTEALHLTNHCKKVYLIHRRDEFRGEQILINQVKNNPKIELVLNAEVDEVLGIENSQFDKFVTGVSLKNTKTEEIFKIDLDGIFVAIGHKPNTDFVKNVLEMDKEGYLTVHDFVKTSVDGIFAAGDVHDNKYRQAITSAGFGCMAALEAEKYIRFLK